jgi:CheY-like chemotaxis protein
MYRAVHRADTGVVAREVRPLLDVLLVEDDDDIRELTRTLLELDGRFAVVGQATNGAQAIVVARRLQPDAVLLDLLLPVMRGAAALPTIRAVAPRAAIVTFSALAFEDPRVQEVSRVADAHLRKDDHRLLAETIWQAWALKTERAAAAAAASVTAAR